MVSYVLENVIRTSISNKLSKTSFLRLEVFGNVVFSLSLLWLWNVFRCIVQIFFCAETVDFCNTSVPILCIWIRSYSLWLSMLNCGQVVQLTWATDVWRAFILIPQYTQFSVMMLCASFCFLACITLNCALPMDTQICQCHGSRSTTTIAPELFRKM